MLNKSLIFASTLMATTLAVAITAPHAKALEFTFSFSNVTGSTPGTVSGKITGLEDNTSNQAADSVIIESFPGSLGGSFDEGDDAVAWNDVQENSFSVTNGEIVSAMFYAETASFNNLFALNTVVLGDLFDANYLTLDRSTDVSNTGGFEGASYSLLSTPVPFGVIPDTGIGILAGIWGISRLRKTMRGRKSFSK